jgi:hypothetical protein
MAASAMFALLAPVAVTAGGLTTGAAPPQTPGVSKLAGSWTWTWKDPTNRTHQHVLEVEGIGKALSAREIFDDEPAVRVAPLEFDGKAVHFTVVRGQRKAEYDGRLDDGDTINGTVKTSTGEDHGAYPWKATRRKPNPVNE